MTAGLPSGVVPPVLRYRAVYRYGGATMLSFLSNVCIPEYNRHVLSRKSISRLFVLVLMLASCHFAFAGVQNVPEANSLQLHWSSQGVAAHHYVLTIDRTAVSGGTEMETMCYYADKNFFSLDVLEGFSYSVRIQTVDLYGNKSDYSEETVFTVENTRIVEKRTMTGDDVPSSFALYPNYPNPFNPVTTIQFDLPRDSQVQLTVYSVTGQKVAELANDRLSAGSHSIVWDAAGMASGTYIYRITADNFNQTRKMLLVK
jgi:hypothetical protein